ncbi:MAG TPA: alpha/beta fold hydrolase [Gemmatimonadales bacterium]
MAPSSDRVLTGQAHAPAELRLAAADGVTLRCLVAGEGPLVVLLHGFPDAPESCWRHQLPALVAAGYRVAAPALRGYGGSDRPSGIAPYALDRLAADVVALVRSLGEERAALVAGHDWGGLVTWYLGAHHPGVADRLAVLNAPHPAALARELRRPGQLLRSLYALFFQLPALPEALLSRGDYAPVRSAVQRAVRRPGAFTEADWEAMRRAIAEPGALRAALAYYRAAGRRTARQLLQRGRPDAAAGDTAVVPLPTLLLWGGRDPFQSERLTHGLERWVPRLAIRHFPDAGHWVHWDAAAEVTEVLISWLAAGRPAG